MEAYSKEFRRDVLRACDAGEGTRAVALRFNVSESWVRRIKQERREQGKVAPSTTRRRRKVWEPYVPWLLAKLDAQPDIYLRELVAAAWEELGWETSDVTISRACRVLRRTRKKRRVLRRSKDAKMSLKRGGSGPPISSILIPTVSCSSMRPGPRRT